MKIIGVGCAPGLLSEHAIWALVTATTIYGSERSIEIARPYISPACVVKTIDDYKRLRELPDDAVILSTGDPMLAGLGYLPGEVIPGISSLQIAISRLHVPLARVAIVVAHGTGHEMAITETCEELRRKKIVFLLTDPKFDVPTLYSRLAGISGPVRIAICEKLGYPDERIVTGTLESPPIPQSELYSMLIGNF
jgi:cobalt-precorrin-7 (C5)-methyltransferase